MAMMAREGHVQTRAEARQLRVILSGWGGDDAVTCHTSTSPAEFLGSHQWAAFRRAIRLRLDRAAPDASPFLKVRRCISLLKGLVSVSLPDSLYAPFIGNAFQMHHAPCAQAAFVRLHRNEVKDMRGPAYRNLANVRNTIRRSIERGHISMRAEHWAASGARHRLVYWYPMLDRRLAEFALGIPSPQRLQTDQRRLLFRRAIGELLPSSVEWYPSKSERATSTALQKVHIKAHSQWAAQLTSETVSRANRFVDPAKILKAVRDSTISGRASDLSGVREAFGCYAIKSDL
jgi:asparagine synthetase B (glutamine-hydrolysing)